MHFLLEATGLGNEFGGSLKQLRSVGISEPVMIQSKLGMS